MHSHQDRWERATIKGSASIIIDLACTTLQEWQDYQESLSRTNHCILYFEGMIDKTSLIPWRTW